VARVLKVATLGFEKAVILGYPSYAKAMEGNGCSFFFNGLTLKSPVELIGKTLILDENDLDNQRQLFIQC